MNSLFIIRKSLALSMTILLTLVILLPVTGGRGQTAPEIEARLREAGANELAGMWRANRRLKLAELEDIYEDVEREMPTGRRIPGVHAVRYLASVCLSRILAPVACGSTSWDPLSTVP